MRLFATKTVRKTRHLHDSICETKKRQTMRKRTSGGGGERERTRDKEKDFDSERGKERKKTKEKEREIERIKKKERGAASVCGVFGRSPWCLRCTCPAVCDGRIARQRLPPRLNRQQPLNCVWLSAHCNLWRCSCSWPGASFERLSRCILPVRQCGVGLAGRIYGV